MPQIPVCPTCGKIRRYRERGKWEWTVSDGRDVCTFFHSHCWYRRDADPGRGER